ncbi:FCD domain-containing protein [Sphingomonas sp.]|uniref:FadR/GntR family transcriptional regulator n=1 Tax=Sphingomonas sp. TaxID=28214 RepID=UPI001B0AC898|nr:FCD domain-containing protein [Sphingomonas sp.]MBO9712010.1 FadR family transcriptional regulator [Sphingomonas sp.]
MSALSIAEGESLVTVAMRSVREHIRSNGLRVGDALPGEHHFASQLGVSRAVMREAFGALAALSVIDVGNGRRARVSAIDGSVMATSLEHAVSTEQVSITEIWDVRRTLELRTVALAALNRTPSEADRITELAQALAAATEPDEITVLDIALHQAIAKATHNIVFHQIVRSFENMMRVAVPAAWRTRTTPEQRTVVRANHLEIAAAIDAGDPARAVAAMDSHFDASVIRAARMAP